ncbi:hypothetical protein DTO212C5_2696 [Paecilomyces variotii]|nr:hypothetical protein DTO212C5_2696 [Paecilomyces variotii]
MKSTEGSTQLVFINGPRLATAGTAEDRRRIRSQLMRRLHLERQEQEEQATGLTNPKKYEFVEELSARPCREVSLTGSKNDITGQPRCSIGPSKTTAEVGTGTVCSERGRSTRDARGKTKGGKRSETPKAKPMTTEAISFPLTRIGSGKVDPFGGPASGRDLPGYNELIDHFLKKLMPTLRHTNSWTQACFEAYLKGTWSPLIFHASCMAVSVHLERTARNNGAINYPSRLAEQLYHKGEALKAIRDALSKPVLGKAILDEIVLCICFIAVHEDIKESLERDFNPFSPPLQDLQGLNFYGFCQINPIHWNAILQLTTQNGGIHTLKLYGAQWFLFFTALKHAMFTCSAPVFPVADPVGKQYGNASPFKILGIPQLPFHKRPNYGFNQLQSLQIKSSIIQTLVDLSELAQGIQLCLPLKDNASVMDLIGDARTLVQYRIQYLPKPWDPLEYIFHDTHRAPARDVYHACWLTATLFSLHVTFPIPCTRLPRESIVPKLREVISKVDSPATGPEVLEILMWCTMIGGIASQDQDSTHRRWYAEKLRKLCLELGIETWASMRRVMCSFGWLDSGCDVAGYSLWIEAHLAS